MCMFCARAIGDSGFGPLPSEQDPTGVTAATLALPEEDAGSDSPVENGSLGTTASVADHGEQRVAGLLSGVRWVGSISYSDPDSAADYEASHPENFTNFQQISAAQLLTAHTALSDTTYTQPSGAYSFSVEGFTNLAITYAGSDTGAGTIRLANTDDPSTVGAAAYAYYPSDGVWGGDAFFGGAGRFPTAGNVHWFAVIHELGHSLGLKHGHETDVFGAVPAAWDSMEFSVMTYRSYVGAPLTGPSNEAFGFAQTYMMLDIAALQHMYGADFSHNGGNTTYSWNPTNGESYVNGNLAIDPGANRIFSTIWDGNGTDTYDLSNYSTNLRLALNPGAHSVLSTAQLADLDTSGGHTARGNVFNALQFNGDARSLIENAIGGSGNDRITGNQASNTLTGNGGNDTLTGGAGRDILIGGAGNDRFDFNLVSDSPVGANRDVLMAGGGKAFDLPGAGAGGDRIDLSDLPGVVWGDLSFATAGGNTRCLINVSGGAAAEMRIQIDDGAVQHTAYVAGDFLF